MEGRDQDHTLQDRIRDAGGRQDDALDRDHVLASVERGLFANTAEPVRVGPFIVLRRLGSGGMGVVYLAHDPRLDRNVAVKLLHPATHGANAADGADETLNTARLVREAKTLAKLSHPNVVTIHEVGETDGRTYIAMEYVEGTDLRQWLEATPRTWQEIVRVFVEAGNGLAAAHRAGLVHRDFKPENLLIDHQDRVRVADFGLARVETQAEPQAETGNAAVPPSKCGDLQQTTATSLTRTGAMVGTPAYMAPEQLLSNTADARSDQFAFCVTLYEGLWGERPFAGDDMLALADALAQGVVRAPRERHGVAAAPSWLRKLVLHGLSHAPEQRFPSMDALLVELAIDRTRRRRRVVLVAGFVALGTISLGSIWTGTRAHCAGVGEEIAEYWNPSRASALRERFKATQATAAVATAERVVERLDAYTLKWSDARKVGCEAQVNATQTPALLDRQQLCLHRARAVLGAALERMESVDAELVVRAQNLVPSLDDIEQCEGQAPLLHGVAPDSDPAHRSELRAVERAYAQALAAFNAGDLIEATQRVQEVLNAPATTRHPPTQARLQLLYGRCLHDGGHPQRAIEALRIAASAADRGGADLQRATAQSLLARRLCALGKHVAAGRALAQAQDALTRTRIPPDHRHAALRVTEAFLSWDSGELESARQQLEALVADGSRNDEQRDVQVTVRLPLGVLHYEAGRYQVSREVLLAGHKLFLNYLGPTHPQGASFLLNLANGALLLGDHEQARAELEQALDLRLGFVDANDPSMANIYTNLGATASYAEDNDAAARWLEQAKAILEHSDPKGLALARVHANLGTVLAKQGNYEGALRAHRAVLETRQLHTDTPAIKLADAHTAVAFDLHRLERVPEARAAYDRAQHIYLEQLGPEHASSILGLLGIASCELSTAPRLALRDARRVLDLASRVDVRPDAHVLARLVVANAMLALGEPEPGARAEVEAAAPFIAKLPAGNARRVRAETWLQQHPPPR